MRRSHVLSATTSAVSWTVFEADDFDVLSVSLVFDAAPTTSENIVLTLDSGEGAAYDTVLRTIDPSAESATTVVIEGLNMFANGDKLKVTYTNTDGNSITGLAILGV